MKKYWTVFLALPLTTFFLTACNTVETDQNKIEQPNFQTPSENENDHNKEVIEAAISTDIQFSADNYTFKLKNISDKSVTLTYNSTQEYEYQIKDQTGNVVYTYSSDKMFGQMIVSKTLAPSEEYQMNVNTDYFSELEPGTYTLEIWSMAQGLANLKTSITFTR